MRKTCATILRWAIGLPILLLVVIAAKIATFPAPAHPGNADCAIILGAAVSGGRPSPVYQARLDHGIALYRTGVVKRLIFTGGVGQGDVISEGDAGAGYAQQNGVPVTDILIDRTSGTTMANLVEARSLMTGHGVKTAVIVSDPLHLRRSYTIAKWLGMEVTASATPHTRYRSLKSRLPFLLRELYFTIHFALWHR